MPPRSSHPVSAADAAKLIKRAYRQGPWPSDAQCYRLANRITVVSFQASRQDYQNAGGLPKRRSTVSAIERFIIKQKSEIQAEIDQFEEHPEWIVPHLQEAIRHLVTLEVALTRASDALLWPPPNRNAGIRRSAWWHQGAQFIFPDMKQALIDAGHSKFSYDRRGPFVRAMAAALEMAGIRNITLAAIAALLQKDGLHRSPN